jgi:hypothetical protein
MTKLRPEAYLRVQDRRLKDNSISLASPRQSNEAVTDSACPLIGGSEPPGPSGSGSSVVGDQEAWSLPCHLTRE